MALIKGYFDASMDGQEGVTVVAGHIGDEDAWSSVERKWKENLDYWKIERFHLTDVLAEMGRERGMLCALSFSSIVMKPSGLTLIKAAIKDSDFNAVTWPPGLREAFPKRQHFCLFHLFDALNFYATAYTIPKLKPDDRLHLAFDADYETEARAAAVYEKWKEIRGHDGFDAFAIVRRQIGLEVADLAAGIERRLGIPGRDGNIVYGGWLQHVKNIAGDDSLGTLWSRELMEIQAEARRLNQSARREPD